MVKRRKGGSTGPALPKLQPTAIPKDPRVASLTAAAARGDVNEIVTTLYGSADQYDIRFLLGTLLEDVTAEPPVWLQSWLAAQPSDLIARTAMGEYLVQWAWEVRTGYRAEHVSAEQFERFHSILREAHRVLIGVVQEEPAMAAAWTPLFAVGMGLQIPLVELGQYFTRCNEHTPWFMPACSAYLQTIAEKWGGTSERESMGFARWVSSQVPAGHYLHGLVAEAHVEHALQNGVKVVETTEAILDLRQALERSRLASPDWGHDRYGRAFRNDFACAAWLAADDQVVAHLMRIMGLDEGNFTDSPWHYFGDPREIYTAEGRRLQLW